MIKVGARGSRGCRHQIQSVVFRNVNIHPFLVCNNLTGRAEGGRSDIYNDICFNTIEPTHFACKRKVICRREF